jgi:glycine/D-amino acid oxidase-like deaminating enzyme
MKICVLGAGVIGLTTAWCLAEAGHDVVIVDRHASTAKDASADNGGQLSYAFVAPLASPATLLKLPSLLPSPDGLFINSGHGMLGWTLACGSARLTADMIDRKPEANAAGAFALRRAA